MTKTKTLRIPKPKRNWSDTDLETWKAKHPVGTPVRFWPVRSFDDEHEDSKICSEPWRLGHGQPVVAIEGRTGGVALDHLVKLPTEAQSS